MARKRTLGGVVLLGLALILAAGVMQASSLGQHYWVFKNRARAMVGKTEAEVRAAMGAPAYVVRREEIRGRALDYPWAREHYRPVPTRAVTNKVLLYRSAWSAAYLFVDRSGRVEHVAVAGT